MRRILAILATAALALGFTAVVSGPAGASITTPANNATVSGNVTVTDSGAKNSGNFYCGDGDMYLRVYLRNSANQNLATLINLSGSAAEGSESATLVTRNHPNGSYKLRSEVRNVVKSGFGGLGCGTSTSNTERNITISNSVSLGYSGALSAPRNTTVAVSASVVDANVGGVAVSGVPVTFSLSSGGGSVTANTNSSGVATANLPVQGNARTATLTISTSGNAYYHGGSITRSFAVEKNGTTTSLAQPATVVHGEPVGFTATVARTSGTGTPSGTVQFKVDGANHGAPVALNASGVAVSPAQTLPTGSHIVQAVYSGDSGFLASTSTTRTATVEKADTTTGLSAAPSPTVSGQQVTFTATVDVVAPGAGDPSGGVQFYVDGQPYGTAVPLSGDTATLSISNLGTGNHQVQATYNGNGDFKASSSAELTHGVDKADSSLALTSSDPAAVAQQPLTYTATATAVGPGAGTPSGTVQFFVDGDPLGDPVALSGGTATSPAVKLSAGSHEVTADYQGDVNFAGANDDYTQQVEAAETSTAVSSSPNPSVFGQPVTLSATVTPVAPSTGTPEGAVQFHADGDPVGSPVTLVDGEAALAYSSLAVGTHAITAEYLSSEADYLNSTSAAASQQVNKAATKTTMSSSAPTAVFGQPVTFTAVVAPVAPGAGAPSGTITFADGGTVLDTVPVDSGTGFQATYTTDELAVGQHAITATYSGDGSFLTSNASVAQAVQKAQTATVVTSSNNPAMTGQSTQFTATVTPVAPGAGLPTGTVQFTLNGMNLGSPVALSDGVATSQAFASLTPGTYQVKAQYHGDGNFRTSSALLDQGMGQGVTKGATSMTLVSGPEPAVHGDPVTVTATVSAVAPATGKPSGVVRFWEGGVLLGAASLVPGTGDSAAAEFVTSSLAPDSHTLRAEYVGNFNFEGAEATTVQTVERIDTVTGVESSANPSTFGDDVTLTAVVNSPSGEPTGTVTFTEGATVLGSAAVATVDGRHVAAITVSGLATGPHEVVASYSGNGRFAGSTSEVFVQQVGRAQATLEAGVPDDNGVVSARLTGLGGAPLAGETIAFHSAPTDGHGKHLCDAVTDADGVASCDQTVINLVLLGGPASLDGGYDAVFAGNVEYLPAQDHGAQF